MDLTQEEKKLLENSLKCIIDHMIYDLTDENYSHDLTQKYRKLLFKIQEQNKNLA